MPQNKNMIEYCKKMYLLYGREVPEICFWNIDVNPHKKDYENYGLNSDVFVEYMLGQEYAICDNFGENGELVEFTDKFIELIKSS